MTSNLQHCHSPLPPPCVTSMSQSGPRFGDHKKVTRIVSSDYISIRHHNKLTSDLRRSRSEVTPQLRSAFLQPRVDRSENLILSSDLLSVRSIRDWSSVRWSFVFDVFYYEMTIETDGEMRIGLAGDHVDLNARKLGSDPFSIALDGYNQCIWHDGISYELTDGADQQQWTVGDVIGIKCDVAEKSVTFLVNGQSIRAPHVEEHFFAVPYYPAASLAEEQQCSINFGKEPFRYSV